MERQHIGKPFDAHRLLGFLQRAARVAEKLVFSPERLAGGEVQEALIARGQALAAHAPRLAREHALEDGVDPCLCTVRGRLATRTGAAIVAAPAALTTVDGGRARCSTVFLFALLTLLQELGRLVQQVIEKLVRVLPQQARVGDAVSRWGEPSGGTWSRCCSKAPEQVVVAACRGCRRVLQAPLSEGQAVVQGLQHRIAVARVAIILQTKVVLALRELGIDESLIQPLGLAPSRSHLAEPSASDGRMRPTPLLPSAGAASS
eukprot:scaffold20889_cov139-Isochrysis_galbana.AAC.4